MTNPSDPKDKKKKKKEDESLEAFVGMGIGGTFDPLIKTVTGGTFEDLLSGKLTGDSGDSPQDFAEEDYYSEEQADEFCYEEMEEIVDALDDGDFELF